MITAVRSRSISSILSLFISIALFAALAQNSIPLSAAYAQGEFTDLGNLGLPDVRFGSTAWGDIDGDGDLDLLLAGETSSGVIARIYRNEGSGSFTDLNAGLPGVSYSSTAWGDFDNDNDLDLLLAGETGMGRLTRIYRNDGDGSFTDLNAQLPGVSSGAAAWGDYDNDGDLDLFLAGSTGTGRIARVYRNDGGIFRDGRVGLAGVSNGAAAWDDYDNDGDLDLLLSGCRERSSLASLQATASGCTPADYIARIYRNNGDGTFTDLLANLPGTRWGPVNWGDMDGDGDLDLLLAGDTGSEIISRLYRNNGDSTFTHLDAGLAGISYGAVDWGDVDQDGDLDLLLSGYTGSESISRIYQNGGDGHFSALDAGLPALAYSAADWGDFDGDGSPTGTQTHPKHTYLLPGLYSVSLDASGPGSEDSEAKTSFVIVDARIYLPWIGGP